MSNRPTRPVAPTQQADIFNGARCKTYSWSQSHDDLEIRIKLIDSIRQDQISVALSKREICVSIKHSLAGPLMQGKFEHCVDSESAYWNIEKDESQLVIFIDKSEEMWWKKLLKNEEASEQGPRNYTVRMDDLDDGSRMAIDKIVTKQRNKLLGADTADSLSPA